MKLVHRDNGGVVVVDSEYGKQLLASGLWKSAEAPKRSSRKTAATKDTKED